MVRHSRRKIKVKSSKFSERKLQEEILGESRTGTESKQESFVNPFAEAVERAYRTAMAIRESVITELSSCHSNAKARGVVDRVESLLLPLANMEEARRAHRIQQLVPRISALVRNELPQEIVSKIGSAIFSDSFQAVLEDTLVAYSQALIANKDDSIACFSRIQSELVIIKDAVVRISGNLLQKNPFKDRRDSTANFCNLVAQRCEQLGGFINEFCRSFDQSGLVDPALCLSIGDKVRQEMEALVCLLSQVHANTEPVSEIEPIESRVKEARSQLTPTQLKLSAIAIIEDVLDEKFGAEFANPRVSGMLGTRLVPFIENRLSSDGPWFLRAMLSAAIDRATSRGEFGIGALVHELRSRLKPRIDSATTEPPSPNTHSDLYLGELISGAIYSQLVLVADVNSRSARIRASTEETEQLVRYHELVSRLYEQVGDWTPRLARSRVFRDMASKFIRPVDRLAEKVSGIDRLPAERIGATSPGI